MRIDGQSIAVENVVARLHHTRVVVVDVAHVEPCAHAMGVECQSAILDDAQVFLEEHDGLRVGVHALGLAVGQSQAMEKEVGGLR